MLLPFLLCNVITIEWVNTTASILLHYSCLYSGTLLFQKDYHKKLYLNLSSWICKKKKNMLDTWKLSRRTINKNIGRQQKSKKRQKLMRKKIFTSIILLSLSSSNHAHTYRVKKIIHKLKNIRKILEIDSSVSPRVVKQQFVLFLAFHQRGSWLQLFQETSQVHHFTLVLFKWKIVIRYSNKFIENTYYSVFKSRIVSMTFLRRWYQSVHYQFIEAGTVARAELEQNILVRSNPIAFIQAMYCLQKIHRIYIIY